MAKREEIIAIKIDTSGVKQKAKSVDDEFKKLRKSASQPAQEFKKLSKAISPTISLMQSLGATSKKAFSTMSGSVQKFTKEIAKAHAMNIKFDSDKLKSARKTQEQMGASIAKRIDNELKMLNKAHAMNIKFDRNKVKSAQKAEQDKLKAATKSMNDIHQKANWMNRSFIKDLNSSKDKSKKIWAAIKKGAIASLSGIGSFISSTFKIAFAGLFGGGFSVKTFFKKIFDAGTSANKFLATMSVITESMFGARQEMKWLRETTQKMGISFTAAAVPFGKFAAAAKGIFTGSEVKEMFINFSKASVALHLSASDVKGVFFALQQMVSKGNVSSEELKRQLAERIPGAMRIAADSMKMSVSELMKALEQGKILASDFMVDFAKEIGKRFAKAAEFAADQAFAEFTKLKDKVNFIFQDLALGGAFESFGRLFKAINEKISGQEKLWRGLGHRIGETIDNLTSFIKGLDERHLVNFANALDRIVNTLANLFRWIGSVVSEGLKLTVGGVDFNISSQSTKNMEETIKNRKELSASIQEQTEFLNSEFIQLTASEAELKNLNATLVDSYNELAKLDQQIEGVSVSTSILDYFKSIGNGADATSKELAELIDFFNRTSKTIRDVQSEITEFDMFSIPPEGLSDSVTFAENQFKAQLKNVDKFIEDSAKKQEIYEKQLSEVISLTPELSQVTLDTPLKEIEALSETITDPERRESAARAIYRMSDAQGEYLKSLNDTSSAQLKAKDRLIEKLNAHKKLSKELKAQAKLLERASFVEPIPLVNQSDIQLSDSLKSNQQEINNLLVEKNSLVTHINSLQLLGTTATEEEKQALIDVLDILKTRLGLEKNITQEQENRMKKAADVLKQGREFDQPDIETFNLPQLQDAQIKSDTELNRLHTLRLDLQSKLETARVNQSDHVGDLADQYKIILDLEKEQLATNEEIVDQTKKQVKELNKFSIELASTMKATFADGFFSFMQGEFGNMADQFKQAIDRMVADALAADLVKYLFGEEFEDGKFGGKAGGMLEKVGEIFTGKSAGTASIPNTSGDSGSDSAGFTENKSGKCGCFGEMIDEQKTMVKGAATIFTKIFKGFNGVFDKFTSVLGDFGDTITKWVQSLFTSSSSSSSGGGLFGSLGSIFDMGGGGGGSFAADNPSFTAVMGGSGGGGSIMDFADIFSFAGGGFTGNNPRTGGVDGLGGFPAILHPNETVIDHSQNSGGSQGSQIVVNVNISGVRDEGSLKQTASQVGRAALSGAQRAMARDS